MQLNESEHEAEEIKEHSLVRTASFSVDRQFEDIDYSFISLGSMQDPFRQPWASLEQSYKANSLYKEFHSYRLKPFIVKANDDLR